MKRYIKPLLVVVAFVLIAISANTTIAYFTSRDKTENVYTVGKIAIEIEEPNWDSSIDHRIKANAEYSKDPTVKNTGKNDAYVRIVLTVSDYEAFMKHGGSDYKISSMFNIGDNWEQSKPEKVESDKIEYVYTYKKVLRANEKTEAFFTKVTMPSFVTDQMVTDLKDEFDVYVKAEAIQAEGFSSHVDAFEAFEAQIGG